MPHFIQNGSWRFDSDCSRKCKYLCVKRRAWYDIYNSPETPGINSGSHTRFSKMGNYTAHSAVLAYQLHCAGIAIVHADTLAGINLWIEGFLLYVRSFCTCNGRNAIYTELCDFPVLFRPADHIVIIPVPEQCIGVKAISIAVVLQHLFFFQSILIILK